MFVVPDAKHSVAIDDQFNRLRIAGAPFFLDVGTKGKRQQHVVAECDCGTFVIVNCNNIKRGLTESCRCLQREVHSERMAIAATTHGGSYTKLYGAWSSMHARCENPKHRFFYRYGERGISVCAEWATFEPFRDWALANGYQPGLSIDRKRNGEGYSPDNCQWITRGENTAKMHRDRKALTI